MMKQKYKNYKTASFLYFVDISYSLTTITKKCWWDHKTSEK